ncbi:MAG: hypothetical protein E7626_05070 [Ruminococcaceae bacterium]|nr:hypothetical protein [Oscillospiraceae bacterium]
MVYTETKRKEFTIINSKKKSPAGVDESKCYRSKKQGDATEKIAEVCRESKDAHITVYGGDGSVYESVNAIMNAGAGDTALLTVVPFGTGNDFVRSLPEKESFEKKIDLIKFGNRYCANILNVGFDCDVVATTEKLKKLKLVKGALAYAIGVVVTLFKKIGKNLEIEFTLEDGTVEYEKGNFLLCAVANGKYYGGGFMCAPNAELDDGILDVILVQKISRLRFATFVGGYKKGLHVTPDGKVAQKYASIAKYKRCTAVKFKGLERLCADGELIPCSEADISVVHNAITIVR